jgi:2-dehydropantoate 2-reductase
MPERIAVVGAGALGGYVGGLLARAGHAVTLIDPWPEHVAAIRADGLRVTGMTEAETCHIQLPALHIADVQSLTHDRPIDIALIAVKSYDTVWATALIYPYLAPGGAVVSLQNCMNEDAVASIAGWSRTLGCIAALVGVELHAPGQIRRNTSRGGSGGYVFYLGEVHGRVTPRVQRLAALIADVDTAAVTTNLWGQRWAKLCVNAMRNSLSAVTGLAGNARDRHPIVRRFAITLGGEAVEVGQALGYEIEPIAGVDPRRLAAAARGDGEAFEEVEARLIGASNTAVRSDLQRPSMAQDIAKGRRTEIDFLNGFIAARGSELGLATPANAFITELVHRVEAGALAPSPDLVAEGWPIGAAVADGRREPVGAPTT